MSRPAYKALYLRTVRRYQDASDRAAAAERELRRLRAVLATHGESVLLPLPAGHEPVALSPLDFEGSRAWIESHARFTPDEDRLQPQEYRWRGRPLHLKEARIDGDTR